MNHLSRETAYWLHVWPRGDCWEWRGPRDQGGYGVFTERRERFKAHRVAYELAKGMIPVGLQLDHLCRNRWCVKPSHLEAVDCRTNLLRGDTLNARAIKKTECPKGHAYTPENTGIDNGTRYCRACKRAVWHQFNRRYTAEHGRGWQGKRPSR